MAELKRSAEEKTTMQEPSPAPLLAQLAPLIIVCAGLAFVLAPIARRKGRSPLLALLAFVPLVNMMFAIWLCSLTDAAVLKDIEMLKQTRR